MMEKLNLMLPLRNQSPGDIKAKPWIVLNWFFWRSLLRFIERTPSPKKPSKRYLLDGEEEEDEEMIKTSPVWLIQIRMYPMAGNFVSKIQVLNYKCDQILSEDEIIDVALPCSCDFSTKYSMLLWPLTSQMWRLKLKILLDAEQLWFSPVCHLQSSCPGVLMWVPKCLMKLPFV